MTDLNEIERLLATGAVQNLHEYQRQLDADGTFVGVSRQALDEVLTVIDAAPAMIAELKALRRATAMGELIASTAGEYDPQAIAKEAPARRRRPARAGPGHDPMTGADKARRCEGMA